MLVFQMKTSEVLHSFRFLYSIAADLFYERFMNGFNILKTKKYDK